MFYFSWETLLHSALTSRPWYLAGKGEGLGIQKTQTYTTLVPLFAQDWPSLRWGRYNDDEVDSINTLQVKLL